MKKKLMIISVSGMLALGGLAAIGGVAGAGGSLGLTKAVSAHADHADSDGQAHAFYAPGVADDKGVAYETGNKPYWRCNDCCASNPNSARYDWSDHAKALSLEEVQIPALTKADSTKVASGDGIANVNTKKFKYVDQGKKGVNASSDDVESTPWFVEDEGKTAIYFSASGKTEQSANCSEFRFTVPEEYHAGCVSVTFSYKYENWGDGTAKGSSMSEPSDFSAMVQFKDVTSAEIEGVSAGYSDYKGLNISEQLDNHAGEWRSITLKYSDAAGKNDLTTDFTDFIVKFADLRGYVMISGLSYKSEDKVVIDKTGSTDLAVGRSAKLALSSGTASSWASSEEDVASIDSDGNLTAKKIGSTVISAKGSTSSDSITINVVAPTSIDGSSLPSSYKASATHTYDVPVVHSGVSKEDAYDFALDSSVVLKDCNGVATSTTIETMKVTAAQQTPGTNTVYQGFYVKFNIATAGTYSIFTNNGYDEKVKDDFWSFDGNAFTEMSSFEGKYENGSDALGKMVCGNSKDAHSEIELQVGTYVVNVGGWGTPQDLDLGIVKVTTTNGTTVVDTPIVSASGDAPTKTVSDSYSFCYLQNNAFYSANQDCGAGTIDGTLHAYCKVDDDYIYGDSLPIEPTYLDGCFGWGSILADSNLSYVSTDIDKHIDSFMVDFTQDLTFGTSPIIYFLAGLGIEADALDAFSVAADYVNKTASFSMTFKGESEAVALSIESISELPVAVNRYDVPNKGEAGEGSGVIDEWGE